MCHVRQGGSMRLAHPAGEGQVTCAAACCTVTVLTSTVLPMIATEKFGLRVSCMRLHKPPRQPAVFSAKSWSKTYYIASFPVTKLKNTKLKFVFCLFFFFFGFQSTSVQLCNSISQQSITQASHLAPNAKKKTKVLSEVHTVKALFSLSFLLEIYPPFPTLLSPQAFLPLPVLFPKQLQLQLRLRCSKPTRRAVSHF